MIRRTLHRRVPATGAVTLILATFAACAESEDGRGRPTDPALLPDGTIEEAGVLEDGGDAAAPPSCEPEAWCVEPGAVDARYALTSIWGTSATDVWAVGSVGTVMHYDGTAWTRSVVETRATLHAVWTSSTAGVWVAADGNTIFHSRGQVGGSVAWEAANELPRGGLGFGPPPVVLSLWGADEHLYASSIAFRDREDGYLDSSAIWGTALSGGLGWEAVGPAACTQCFPVTAVGVPGRIVWGAGSKDVWTIFGHRVFRSDIEPDAGADGGVARVWEEIDSQSNGDLHAIWGASSADVWLVGQTGRIRRWRAGSPVAELAPSPTRESLHAVWGASVNDVWAVGDAGTILHWDGDAWRREKVVLPSGKAPNLYGVWGSGSAAPWVVGEGVILRYQGKGT